MSYAAYNIEIPNGRVSGEVATICPNCSHGRKKKSTNCLQVNLDKQVWNCKHCGWAGGLRPAKKEEITFTLPEWDNKTELSDRVVKWFESRRISQQTLEAVKISETKTFMPQISKEANCICFNYFHDGVLKNVKYRDGQKNFKLHKGAELILYNLDSISGDVWITEGEIDCLSLIEAGIKSVVSVPNGATLTNNNLSYLDNYLYLFTGRIHLALDNDIAGRKLREDLADRFGRYRCDYIEFAEHKDANEFLKYEGPQALAKQAQEFKEFPMIGVFTVSDMVQEIEDMYYNGLPTGQITGMGNFDNHLRFEKGYITTITGIPSHGKSDFLDQLTIKLSLRAGWKGAFYSPENKPTRLHFSKLARKLTGKPWIGEHKMPVEDVMRVMSILDQNFWFIKPEKDFTLDTILSHVRELQMRKGIDWFVIDAWNKLEHKYSTNETRYIGESLDQIAVFCEQNNLHCFLVAHPTKMKRKPDGKAYEVPTLYDISGSANFFNKTDNGITIYRDFTDNVTEVHIQKVKFNHWGLPGMCVYTYDIPSGRYIDEFENLTSWI